MHLGGTVEKFCRSASSLTSPRYLKSTSCKVIVPVTFFLPVLPGTLDPAAQRQPGAAPCKSSNLGNTCQFNWFKDVPSKEKQLTASCDTTAKKSILSSAKCLHDSLKFAPTCKMPSQNTANNFEGHAHAHTQSDFVPEVLLRNTAQLLAVSTMETGRAGI